MVANSLLADGLGMSPPKARCVGSNPTVEATPL